MKFVIDKKIILILFLTFSFQAHSRCIYNSMNWIAVANGVELVSSMRSSKKYSFEKGGFIETREVDGRKLAKGMVTNTYLKPAVRIANEAKFYQICYKEKDVKK